ncbi:transporter substrate-binding domain-containing protein [Rhodovulum sp. YEN HP10]|uniref:transporter substrate-binding domain-containing protein n=1 Tax=Rhodovulum sp. HP10 TaxID=3387397 RepID=UPI0039DF2D42
MPALAGLVGLLAALVLVLSLPAPARAQPSSTPPPAIVTGWLDDPPFWKITPTGGPVGFVPQLVDDIRTLTGLPIETRRYGDMQSRIAAQIAGESQLMFAVARLPALEATHVFTEPIAHADVHLFVLTENANRPDYIAPVGKRIGKMRQYAGSDPASLLKGNRTEFFDEPATMLLKLLSGEIDGALMAEDWVMGLARSVRLDHRIAAVGPPVLEFDRVIAIHNSRADLLEPLNRAIATLEADGTLSALRQQWLIEAAPPPPDILTVGVVNLPPFSEVREDGTMTGFSVEVMRDLGKILGVELKFQAVSPELWARGPQSPIDILPLIGITPERELRMDFALPIQSINLAVFVRSEHSETFDGLSGLRVGTWKAGVASSVAQRHTRDILHFDNYRDLLTALFEGRIDAIIAERGMITRIVAEKNRSEEIAEVPFPLPRIFLAPALRPGLPTLRESLNLVIPGYLASQRYQDLRADWLGTAPFWTNRRILLTLGGFGALMLLAIGYIPVQRHRMRQERLRFTADMVERIPLGLLMIAPNGRIEFVNSAAKAISPSGPELIREGADFRQAVRALIMADARHWGTKSPAALAAALSGPGLNDGDYHEFQTAAGEIFRWSSFSLPDGSILVMMLDVTRERRNLAEIEDLNAELRAQIAIVQRTNAELRDFAYATSHDLKSPINTLMLIADALAEAGVNRLPDEDRALIEDMHEILARMARMISDVLDYTRAVGGEQPPDCVELSRIVSEVMQDLAADIAASGARLRVDDLPRLTGNPRQLHQLMQNLISNAIKFRLPDKSPEIDIETVTAPPGMIAFSVSDRGIGIDPKFHDRIFQLFTHLNDTDLYPGSGLGLAICQRVALNHGGRIMVQSTPGAGSRFTVFLKEKQGDQQVGDDRRLQVRAQDGQAPYSQDRPRRHDARIRNGGGRH